jgi:hypothetical protein
MGYGFRTDGPGAAATGSTARRAGTRWTGEQRAAAPRPGHHGPTHHGPVHQDPGRHGPALRPQPCGRTAPVRHRPDRDNRTTTDRITTVKEPQG